MLKARRTTLTRRGIHAAGKAKSGKAVRRRAPRMDPAEREGMIVERAIEYFSAEGFDGTTRELAAKIGVTQPLLYRYFPTKEALVNKVYERVYMARWKPVWEEWLHDRSVPIEERLKRYYVDYANTMLNNHWIRILIFAGLRQAGIDRRLFKFLRERIFTVVLAELYHGLSLKAPRTTEEKELEIELVWALHASIFYLGMRRWVYQTPVPENIEELVQALVDGFIQNIVRRAKRR
jgi:AcrR family transcriptional regulator